MKQFLESKRPVGMLAAVLLALSAMLPWFSVTSPFMGSFYVYGLNEGGHGDGWLVLGGAGLVAVLALFVSRMWLGILGALFAALYVAEIVHAHAFMQSGEGDPNPFVSMASVTPSIGVLLGVAVGVALAVWGLVLPRLRGPVVAGTEAGLW